MRKFHEIVLLHYQYTMLKILVHSMLNWSANLYAAISEIIIGLIF